jgi:hypothetical protein
VVHPVDAVAVPHTNVVAVPHTNAVAVLHIHDVVLHLEQQEIIQNRVHQVFNVVHLVIVEVPNIIYPNM